MAGTPDTRGGRRTPARTEKERPDPLLEAVKARVAEIFDGVDLETPGTYTNGLLTSTVVRDEDDGTIHAQAMFGSLVVAQFEKGPNRDRRISRAYALFGENYIKRRFGDGLDQGTNLSYRIVETGGKVSSCSFGGNRYVIESEGFTDETTALRAMGVKI